MNVQAIIREIFHYQNSFRIFIQTNRLSIFFFRYLVHINHRYRVKRDR